MNGTKRTARNVTDSHDSADSLTDAQLMAVDLLVMGKPKAEVARTLNLARETVSRWHREPAFIAALNEARHDVHAANMERIRELTVKALDVLEHCLEPKTFIQTRLKAATTLLSLSLRLPAPTGPTNASDVIRQQAVDEMFRF